MGKRGVEMYARWFVCLFIGERCFVSSLNPVEWSWI